MKIDLFKLVGSITIDNQTANAALDNTSNKAKSAGHSLDDMADSGSKGSGKLNKFFGALGKGAAAVGKAAAVGIAAAGVAISAVTFNAVSAVSELEQNMGGSEAVFGEYAERMQSKAKEAYANMGLSTSDFLATANKMGALFQGAGFGIEESANLSADAMQRAADVASIMGIDTASAMEAVAGAAKGNFTMMDNLGVAMNETTLANYALEKGMSKTYDQMTQQERIGVAMEMFLDKTSYAAGNYAKENETLAGSLGTAKAALTNFLDGSGSVDQLVGALAGAADVVVRNIGEMFPSLMNGLTELVNKIVPKIPPLLQQLLPGLISGAVSLIHGLVAAMPQVVDALMSVLPPLLSGIVQLFNAIVEALPMLMQSICSALPTLIPQLINGIVLMIVTLCNSFAQIIQPLIDALPGIITSLVDALMDNLPAIIQGLITLVIAIVQAIPQIIQALIDAIPTVLDSILSGIIAAFPAIITGLISLVWELFTALIDLILTNPLLEPFREIWGAIKDTISNIFDGIRDKISTVVNSIKETVTNVFNRIKDAMSAPIEKAKEIISGIVEKIKGFFKFKVELPKIKLPHFGIKPEGWKIGDLLKGSIPKLGIEWYAKAMNNPMLLDDPTVFGYDSASGNLLGGGEAGAEVVAGANPLMHMIRGAVSSAVGDMDYYLQQIIAVLADYFPQLVQIAGHDIYIDGEKAAELLANPMNEQLGKIAAKKGRGR